jgi:hypothetical protein
MISGTIKNLLAEAVASYHANAGLIDTSIQMELAAEGYDLGRPRFLEISAVAPCSW